MGIKAPLMAADSSEARNTNSCAIDSGCTHLEKSACGMLFRLRGVSIVVGSIPLTLMPEPPISSASTLIKATNADLVTIYAAVQETDQALHARQCAASVPFASEPCERRPSLKGRRPT
jgi:hypothetical protein